MRPLWILVAGPYATGAATAAERAANLARLNDAALALHRLGHVPVIGVNAALPLIERAGEAHYDEIMLPLSLALAERCDAVLRIGGASAGAEREVERLAARGGRVFRSLAEIPAPGRRDGRRGAAGSDSVVVRESTPLDAESFRTCLDVVAQERRYLALLAAPPLDEVRRFLDTQRQRGMVQLVAAEAECIVGWCDVIPKSIDGFRHSSDLGMGLLPAYRGRGLGRALLERTLERVRSTGLLRVELEVYAGNTPAIALYESCGFQQEGCRRRARLLDGVAEDVIEMAILLDESAR